MTTTLLPGLLDALARNVGRGATDVGAVRDRHRSRSRTTAAPAPDPAASTAARPRTSSPTSTRRCPTSRCTSRVVLAGERERAGWWGAGRPAGWADAIEAVRVVADALGPRGRPCARPPARPGTPAAAPSCSRRRRRRSATPASCTRKVCQAFGVPAAHRRPPRSTSTLLLAARRRRRRRPRRSRPTRSPRRTSRSSSTTSVPAAEVEAALREGAGDAAGVGPALRRLHRRAGRRGQEVAGLRAALPGARPHPDRGRRPRAARDAAVALAAERHRRRPAQPELGDPWRRAAPDQSAHRSRSTAATSALDAAGRRLTSTSASSPRCHSQSVERRGRRRRRRRPARCRGRRTTSMSSSS